MEEKITSHDFPLTQTIVAQATPAGRGGVGIVRVSGPLAMQAASLIVKQKLTPRFAHYGAFYGANDQVIDQGIALFFKGPHSFTGEDVLELQAHGGPVILDFIIETLLTIKDIRLAKPGEFSEQAFLNNKLDLTQAEAIADLINASSKQAAQSAMQTLQGAFSKKINGLFDQLTYLRMFIESAIDFPEEEIDFLSDKKITTLCDNLSASFAALLDTATQGAILQEGMSVVIAGKPNAGKSSLLNVLSGQSAAIVTDIPGTTRDVLHMDVECDGLPLHIMDTAGLRLSDDVVEQEGVRRALAEIEKANIILLLADASKTDCVDPKALLPDFFEKLPDDLPVIVVRNKIDLIGEAPGVNECVVSLSAKTGDGIDLLKRKLKAMVGYHEQTEGVFSARRRHLDALRRAFSHIENGVLQLQTHKAGELLAEECRLAQLALGEITGQYSSDDLLGKIFSTFCIGK